MNDKQILEKRRKMYNSIRGIRIGDFIKLNSKNYTRVTYTHTDGTIQTGGNGGSYYLGNGSIQYSGGLDSGYHINDLKETNEKKIGEIWFFHNDYATGGGGVNFNMKFRVFEVKKTFKPQYKKTLVKNEDYIIWSDQTGNGYVITKLNEKPKSSDYVFNVFNEAQNVLFKK